ncbi:hypothetical protein KIPB_007235 [Kipferlia bialata]|uniref:Uncharacterized protein n=1 Tax=Kipferlia bialata TaxID=797122 RepID=A0A9K3CY81_9EUKA|nr:hypothetical protein KIPB_003528 [Kipferlia bialata]GIQ82743.1 hypothetical protein KIPB_003936 [Kipferlia bialata]GIQ83343.1 hypothetical protein KIPB_004648 [Kipferlia bialata]GIQ85548.1 hypothetical protein KIPB_007235 [Kipferlia bialata]|eukprot:g3528.t1
MEPLCSFERLNPLLQGSYVLPLGEEKVQNWKTGVPRVAYVHVHSLCFQSGASLFGKGLSVGAKIVDRSRTVLSSPFCVGSSLPASPPPLSQGPFPSAYSLSHSQASVLPLLPVQAPVSLLFALTYKHSLRETATPTLRISICTVKKTKVAAASNREEREREKEREKERGRERETADDAPDHVGERETGAVDIKGCKKAEVLTCNIDLSSLMKGGALTHTTLTLTPVGGSKGKSRLTDSDPSPSLSIGVSLASLAIDTPLTKVESILAPQSPSPTDPLLPMLPPLHALLADISPKETSRLCRYHQYLAPLLQEVAEREREREREKRRRGKAAKSVSDADASLALSLSHLSLSASDHKQPLTELVPLPELLEREKSGHRERERDRDRDRDREGGLSETESDEGSLSMSFWPPSQTHTDSAYFDFA